MEKIFRYIIIIFAISLTVILLYPLKSINNGFYSSVDSNIASIIILKTDSAADYWNSAIYHKKQCRINNRYCYHPFRLEFYDHISDVLKSNYATSELKEAAQDYFACREKNDQCDNYIEKVFILGEPIYEEYLNQQRIFLGYKTWIANIIALFLGLSLIIFRKNLAHKIYRTLTRSKIAAENAVKKIHENI